VQRTIWEVSVSGQAVGRAVMGTYAMSREPIIFRFGALELQDLLDRVDGRPGERLMGWRCEGHFDLWFESEPPELVADGTVILTREGQTPLIFQGAWPDLAPDDDAFQQQVKAIKAGYHLVRFRVEYETQAEAQLVPGGLG